MDVESALRQEIGRLDKALQSLATQLVAEANRARADAIGSSMPRSSMADIEVKITETVAKKLREVNDRRDTQAEEIKQLRSQLGSFLQRITELESIASGLRADVDRIREELMWIPRTR